MLTYNWSGLNRLACLTAKRIAETINVPSGRGLQVYANPVDPVPAIMVVDKLCSLTVRSFGLSTLTNNFEEADVFVDMTNVNREDWYRRWCQSPMKTEDPILFPEGIAYFPLFPLVGGVIDAAVLPYEQASPIVDILKMIGEDPTRDGLRETPARVEKSWKHLFAGYKKNPADVLKEFESSYDEMVVLKNIEMYSVCEHHMQPFFGHAHVAYLPNEKVVGISKLARVLEIYSRRLQIQERICQQVTDALMEHLNPKGAACVIEAKHFCMMCRGVEKQNSTMMTSSLKGAFREPAVRAEFFSLIKG
jgi:GTP cyclohydrolase IA